MCEILSSLFKKHSEQVIKYVPLQKIICDPTSYPLKNCTFINVKDKIAIEKYMVEEVCFEKIGFTLGGYEFLKYDYILDMFVKSDDVLIINTFTTVNTSGELIVDDNITSIVLKFEKNIAYKVMKQLLKYINSYQKYDTHDKSVLKFKSYKNYLL